MDEAFKRTGYSKEDFKVTKTAWNEQGVEVPVEWRGPNSAEVNIDWPHNSTDPITGETFSPDAPHIGYSTGGKNDYKAGHIILDEIGVGRYKKN